MFYYSAFPASAIFVAENALLGLIEKIKSKKNASKAKLNVFFCKWQLSVKNFKRHFKFTLDICDVPRPRSSEPFDITIDLPIISLTLTKLSSNRNSARPFSSAITLPRSPTCLSSSESTGLPCLVLRGLKWPPTVSQPPLRSPHSWIAKACSPGLRPSIVPSMMQVFLFAWVKRTTP